MPNIALAGPSYALRNRTADVQRCVNWVPVQIESGTGKGGAQSYLKQVPGKTAFGSALAGPIRGARTCRGLLYVVAGTSLYRVSAAGAATVLGSVAGTSPVGMSDNNTQLCITTGEKGYVLDLDTDAFSTISTNWLGSARVDVLDGYGLFTVPGSAQIYTSNIQDFSQIDALSYAAADSSTGAVVAHLVKHREALILKERSGEVWYDAGNIDGIPLSVNTGASIEAGCMATHSLRKIAGLALWLGQDDRGSAVVFAMSSYVPQRISTHALEELLSARTQDELSASVAYTYHHEGLSYYVLQVPGLSTTWVYELAGGIWHERGEWVDGAWTRDLGVCHAHAYGRHIVGGSDGVLYTLDVASNRSAGRALVRDRITPHAASPSLDRVRFASAQIDCNVGIGLSGADAELMLRYSNDGGMVWGSWRHLSLGNIGEYQARCRATMLGAARDRVWQIRVTDDVRCEPVSMIVNES